MISKIPFQKAGVQKPGTTARSRQISPMVRPTARRRTWRSRSCSVGMKSWGSSEPGGSDGRFAALGEDGWEVGGAEAGRDGGECGGGGPMLDGGEEVAAVAEQDADNAEHAGDVLGHGAAG